MPIDALSQLKWTPAIRARQQPQHHLQTMPRGFNWPYLHLTSHKSEGIPKSGQSRISEVPEPFYKMRFETVLVEQTHSASHAQNWKHLNKVLQLYTVCRAH